MNLSKSAFITLLAVGSALASHPANAACIPSGTDASINAALKANGSVASLCPNAVFNLSNPVQFTAPNQEVSTQGYPTDGSRATLRVVGGGLSLAISGNGRSGIKIRNIQVDGSRPALGRLATGSALIEIGGYSTGQLVQQVHAYEPRGWSALHIAEGNVAAGLNCSGAQILNNQIGPSGEPDSQWADGISLACTKSYVENNVVTDATDGGIVIFGAPGSVVMNNTIQEPTRVLLGGINLVDYAPYSGNYAGTLVSGNTINSGSGSGYIKVGIGVGASVWTGIKPSGVNVGGTVSNNSFTGNGFGYATAVNGAENFTVASNILSAANGAPIFDGLMNNCSGDAGPFAFNYAPGSTGNFAGSSPRVVADGICITPQFNFRLGAFTSHTNQEINMGELMFAVMQSDGNFVLYGAPGQALWSTRTQRNCSALDCIAVFQTDGNFVLYQGSTPFWNSATNGRGATQVRFAPVSPWFQVVSGTGVLYQGN